MLQKSIIFSPRISYIKPDELWCWLIFQVDEQHQHRFSFRPRILITGNPGQALSTYIGPAVLHHLVNIFLASWPDIFLKLLNRIMTQFVLSVSSLLAFLNLLINYLIVDSLFGDKFFFFRKNFLATFWTFRLSTQTQPDLRKRSCVTSSTKQEEQSHPFSTFQTW